MYEPGYYKNLDEKKVAEDVRQEGFDPVKISDSPGHVYSPHRHPETKLLAFLEGGMEVRVGSETYQCSASDKVIIPGNVEHSAVVGSEGCEFFWSEKLM